MANLLAFDQGLRYCLAMSKDHFAEIIGQQKIKPQLNLYVQSHRANGGFLKPIFFAAAKGNGKTKLARCMGAALLGSNGQPKKFAEVNGASIRKLSDFVDQVVSRYINGGQEVTLFVDEIHSVEGSVLDWLLTVLSLPDDKTETRNFYSGNEYVFDYKKFSFLCASTNPEQLPQAFSSRLTKIELQPYSEEDLIEILIKCAPSIEIDPNIVKSIVSVCRDNPRNLVEGIGRDLKLYCSLHNTRSFCAKHWKEFKRIFNICEFGLRPLEIQLLDYLKQCGPQTLTAIAAKLGLDVGTVRKDTELFLLSRNLISIDGKRSITYKGLEVLRKIIEGD